MTPHTSQTDTNLQAELDRLTYSAYLLTLDPGKAFSAVERAIDGSMEETTVHSDLLERDRGTRARRTYSANPEQAGMVSHRPMMWLLYGHSQAINSKAFQSLAGSERQPHPSARCDFPHSLRSPSPAGIQRSVMPPQRQG